MISAHAVVSPQCQILIRAPNMDSSAAEMSPQRCQFPFSWDFVFWVILVTCLPLDGLPLPRPWEGSSHLLWDQSHCSGHSRLLRKSDQSEPKTVHPLSVTEKNYVSLPVSHRLSFMTSSTRTWTRWPILKERRNLPCTEAGGAAQIIYIPISLACS